MAFVDPKAGLVMLKDIEKCHAVNGEPVQDCCLATVAVCTAHSEW